MYGRAEWLRLTWRDHAVTPRYALAPLESTYFYSDGREDLSHPHQYQMFPLFACHQSLLYMRQHSPVQYSLRHPNL